MALLGLVLKNIVSKDGLKSIVVMEIRIVKFYFVLLIMSQIIWEIRQIKVIEHFLENYVIKIM